MKLVVDTNILMAALIKDSSIRKIIVTSKHDFYIPQAAVEEIYGYIDLISKKNSLSREENLQFLSTLLKYMKKVDFEFYKHKMKEGKKIIGKIDKKDIPFIALALSFENNGIWTEDKHFEKQKKIKTWRTTHLLSLKH